MATGNFFKHWPTMLLGLIVAVVLLTAVFSFQLNQTEVAVVTTFGRPTVVEAPGLHFRWPFPFQKVYRFDKRIRCFEGSSGKLEETATRDGHNILAGIYVDYRIGNPEVFFKQLKDIPNAEEVLNNLMRSEKNSAFGLYNFNQIVNTDPAKLKLNEIQNQIKSSLIAQTGKFGIDIVGVGINSLGVPKTITEKVFDRMSLNVNSSPTRASPKVRARRARSAFPLTVTAPSLLLKPKPKPSASAPRVMPRPLNLTRPSVRIRSLPNSCANLKRCAPFSKAVPRWFSTPMSRPLTCSMPQLPSRR